MLTLRHDSALREKNTWSICQGGVRIRFEYATVDLPLCVSSNPQRGSFIVTRITGGWVIAPSVYEIDLGKWWAKSSPFHKLAPYEFLLLLNGPKHAEKYLEQL